MNRLVEVEEEEQKDEEETMEDSRIWDLLTLFRPRLMLTTSIPARRLETVSQDSHKPPSLIVHPQSFHIFSPPCLTVLHFNEK